jgi:hypothetical protein
MPNSASTWYCLPLQTEVDADAEKAWQAVWKSQQGGAEECAGGGIFRLLAAKAGEALYFSPEAAELADVFGANPCDKPAPDGLRFMAGDPRAWEVHFPGAQQADLPQPKPAAGDDQPAFAPTEPSGHLPLE